MRTHPDGLLSQATGLAAGFFGIAQAFCVLYRRPAGALTFGLAAFFACCGASLVVGAVTHQLMRRGRDLLVLWVVIALLQSLALAGATLAHTRELFAWSQKGSVAAAAACALFVPAILQGLRWSKRGLTDALWAHVQLQMVVAVTFFVAAHLHRWRGAEARWMVVAATLAFTGVGAQQLCKRRGWYPAGLDYNSLFHLFIGAALVAFYLATATWGTAVWSCDGS